MRTDRFFDTNVLVYSLDPDLDKASIALSKIREGGFVSTQVLNEFISIARRKLKVKWPEVRQALANFESTLTTNAVSIEAQKRAVDIAETTGFNIYDALHLACAEEASCSFFVSEDLSHGQRVGGVTVLNPFR
jgi:predicted nucleic acid-binding protein